MAGDLSEKPTLEEPRILSRKVESIVIRMADYKVSRRWYRHIRMMKVKDYERYYNSRVVSFFGIKSY